MQGFYILPGVMQRDKNWKENFRKFIEEYSDDFCNINIDAELHMWEIYWADRNDIDDKSSFKRLLKETQQHKLTFPAIRRSLEILATIPVTSTECERSISVLRLLKTYLRNTMGQTRFASLARLYIHRDVKLNTERIINDFARSHPTRMKLMNILMTDEIEERDHM